VRVVEQSEHAVTVTLDAVAKPAAEDDALGAAWNELKGLTVTRSLALGGEQQPGERALAALSPEVSAAVEEGGVLAVRVPYAAAEAEPPTDDATGATVEDEMAEVDDVIPLKKRRHDDGAGAGGDAAQKDPSAMERWTLEELEDIILPKGFCPLAF